MLNFEQKRLLKKTPERTPLEVLLIDSDLSVRTCQALKNSNIFNLGELADDVKSGLIKNNLGLNSKRLQEIEELLRKHDLWPENGNVAD